MDSWTIHVIPGIPMWLRWLAPPAPVRPLNQLLDPVSASIAIKPCCLACWSVGWLSSHYYIAAVDYLPLVATMNHELINH